MSNALRSIDLSLGTSTWDLDYQSVNRRGSFKVDTNVHKFEFVIRNGAAN